VGFLLFGTLRGTHPRANAFTPSSIVVRTGVPFVGIDAPQRKD